VADYRRRMYRLIGSVAAAALLATASLAAQTDKRSLTSAVGQVRLSAVMLPTAHLDGSSRIVGWRRSDSGAEGVATLAVLPNSAYRLVVYRIDQEGPAAAEASRRIWVEGADGRLEEVRVGRPAVIRRPGVTHPTQAATLRIRTDLGGPSSASPAGLPLRYEIQIQPTL
jgi:hypothetical protein